MRLEQGRDRNPSIQVLEALARVLSLDRAATDYLVGLAVPRPRNRRRRPRRETVQTGIRQLLDVLGLPASVQGRYFDVLAANDLAHALSPNLQAGQNRLRAMFLDPAEKALFPDWDDATARMVADFRESVGSDADDPRVVQLVGELSLSSERFPARPLQSPATRSWSIPHSRDLTVLETYRSSRGSEYSGHGQHPDLPKPPAALRRTEDREREAPIIKMLLANSKVSKISSYLVPTWAKGERRV